LIKRTYQLISDLPFQKRYRIMYPKDSKSSFTEAAKIVNNWRENFDNKMNPMIF